MPNFVLGVDVACGHCADWGRQIAAVAPGHLVVTSLSAPEMAKWRRDHLGKNAPWTPTLAEFDGSTVRVHTGSKIAIVLARHLSPKQVWRIMVIIGSNHRPLPILPGLSRSQFLRGVAGGAIGAGVLAGRAGNTATAESNEDEEWLAGLQLVSRQDLSAPDTTSALRLAIANELSEVLADPSTQGHLGAMDMLNGDWERNADSDPAAVASGASHAVSGGGVLDALGYQRNGDAVVFYRLRVSGQPTRTAAKVLRVPDVSIAADIEAVEIEAIAWEEDGNVYLPSARSCTRARDCGGTYCYNCRCKRWSFSCVFNCCGPCAFACKPPRWTCLICVAVYCPVCMAINRCCTKKACSYRPGINC